MTVPQLSSASNPSAQDIVVDSNGNATAIWVETDSMGNSNVVASNLQFNTANWSAPVQLSFATKSVSPQISADANGNVYAIWLESTNGLTGTVVSKTYSAGSWGSATSLSASATASFPQIGAGGNLNAVAVWLEGNAVNSKTNIAGVWGGVAETISTSGAVFPQVAVNKTGTKAVASWHVPSGATPPVNNVYIASKTIGMNFSAAQLFSDPATQSVFARVAIDNSGNFVAVWYMYNLTQNGNFINLMLQARAQENGILQSIATLNSFGGNINPNKLVARIAIDDSGDAIAFWNNSIDGGLYYISTAYNDVQVLMNSSDWNQTIQIEWKDIYALDLDISAGVSDALAVWMSQDPLTGNSQIYGAGKSLLGNSIRYSLTTPSAISNAGNNAFPRISVMETGTNPPNLYGIALWQNKTSPAANNTLQWASGVWTNASNSPPTALGISVNSNNLGVFTEIQKTISWTANPSSNVVAYHIYRIVNSESFFIAEVDASTTQFTDSNASAGTDTYGISTLDGFGNESAMAQVSG